MATSYRPHRPISLPSPPAENEHLVRTTTRNTLTRAKSQQLTDGWRIDQQYCTHPLHTVIPNSIRKRGNLQPTNS